MTILQQVRDLVKEKSPNALCDDCIADILKLTVRQHANHKTRELEKAFGFNRGLGPCSVCKNIKKVISYAHRI